MSLRQFLLTHQSCLCFPSCNAVFLFQSKRAPKPTLKPAAADSRPWPDTQGANRNSRSMRGTGGERMRSGRCPRLLGLSRRLGGCARLTCLAGGGGGTLRGEGAPRRWMRWGAGPGSRWARARGDRSWAAPSRRGSPGFPVMGLWGACPGQPGREGSRASAVPRAWPGSASCSHRRC